MTSACQMCGELIVTPTILAENPNDVELIQDFREMCALMVNHLNQRHQDIARMLIPLSSQYNCCLVAKGFLSGDERYSRALTFITEAAVKTITGGLRN